MESKTVPETYADPKLATEPGSFADHARGRQFSVEEGDRAMLAADQNMLHRKLKGRHMQMIAM